MIFPEAWMEKKMVDHPGTTPVRPEVSSDAGWRPIDSAPRDGTAILAYNPVVGVYSTAFTTRWTGEPDECGYEGYPCGFWPNGIRSSPFGKWDCQPTHWQALPEPPK